MRLSTPVTRMIAVLVASAAVPLAIHREPRADAPFGRFTDLDCAGTPCVKDTKTGLVWKKAEQSITYTWSDAKVLCTPSFRLPTIRELQSLLDETRTAAPLIDASKFPGATADWFWSSSPHAPSPSTAPSAWALTFLYGNTFHHSTGMKGRVRCVR